MYAQGEHRNVYHIGNDEMVSIADLVALIAELFGREFQLVPSEAAAGGTPVRCPDITKMAALGYQPAVPLREGLARTKDWYAENAADAASALL